MHLKPLKIVYLILLSENDVYWHDMHSQRDTWATEDSKVIWISGWNNNYTQLKDRILYLPIINTYNNILLKTLMGIEWCLANLDFDFIVRTNTSTYFNTQNTYNLLNLYKNENYFSGGYIEKCEDIYFQNRGKIEFMSGCGIFLSKLCALEIMSIDHNWYLDVPEDIAISHFLWEREIKITRIPRNNVHFTHIYLPATHARLKSSRNGMLASKRMNNLSDIAKASNFQCRFIALIGFYRTELMDISWRIGSLKTYLINVRYIFINYYKIKRKQDFVFQRDL